MYYGKTHYLWATKIRVSDGNWNAKDKEIIRGASDRKKLADMKSFAEKLLRKLNGDEIEITTEILRTELDNEFRPTKTKVLEEEAPKHSNYVVKFFEKYIEDCRTGEIKKGDKSIKKELIKNYDTSLGHLKLFESYYGRYKFSQLDKKHHKKFLNFLTNEFKLSSDAAGNTIKNLKMLGNYANSEGVEVDPILFGSFYFKPSIPIKPKPIYYNEEEIQRIFDYDFSDNPRLDNTRDIFIIGLCTGLRISDFMQLSNEKISTVDGKEYFSVIQKKTGGEVFIPLHKLVRGTIKKLGGQLPKKITDVKFNLYVKEVCEKLEFDELVKGIVSKKIEIDLFGEKMKVKRGWEDEYPRYELTASHVCRRSFATNNFGKLPNKYIQAVTGHKTETQFLKYVKLTAFQEAKALGDVWDKEEATEETELQKALKEIERLKLELNAK